MSKAAYSCNCSSNPPPAPHSLAASHHKLGSSCCSWRDFNKESGRWFNARGVKRHENYKISEDSVCTDKLGDNGVQFYRKIDGPPRNESESQI